MRTSEGTYGDVPRQRIQGEFVPKVKIEIALPDELVDQVIDAILKSAKTGKFGDGKVFVAPLEQVVRVRTGEYNERAL